MAGTRQGWRDCCSSYMRDAMAPQQRLEAAARRSDCHVVSGTRLHAREIDHRVDGAVADALRMRGQVNDFHDLVRFEVKRRLGRRGPSFLSLTSVLQRQNESMASRYTAAVCAAITGRSK